MKTKSKLLACILALACFASVFTGCGLVNKKNKTPWQDEVKDQIPDKLDKNNMGEFYLEGKMYKFPMKVSEFLNNGWSYEASEDKSAKLLPGLWYDYKIKLNDGNKHTITVEAYNAGEKECSLSDCYVGLLTLDRVSGKVMVPGDISLFNDQCTFNSYDDLKNFAADDVVFTDQNSYDYRKQASFTGAEDYPCKALFVFEPTETPHKMSMIEYECSFTIPVIDYIDCTLKTVTENDPSYVDALDKDNGGADFLASERAYLADYFLYVYGFDLEEIPDDVYENFYKYMDMVYSKTKCQSNLVSENTDTTVVVVNYTAPKDFDATASDILSHAAESYEGDIETAASDPVFASLFMEELVAHMDDFEFDGINRAYTITYNGDVDELNDDIDIVLLCQLGMYEYLNE
ncbi:MAG: hypothetical protein J5379_10605 [Clostridiales bacterium]|nr:hypothetical protein [Clostridiales bacterium]